MMLNNTQRLVGFFLLLVWAVVGIRQAVGAADTAVDFETQIAPIIQQHCIRCHSPGNNKGDVSLSTIEDLRESEYIVRGDPDSSHLIELITAADDAMAEMPKESDPLSEGQVALMRRWITEGADWPTESIVREKPKADASWWSLQPLESNRSQTIDDFVSERLALQGLSLSPKADRRALIRRATYDLIGLPPTPAEVQAFVADTDPMAYENLIDRLLASPRYGERWGRHWLDVIRFGESIGYERNVLVHDLWPFRDYVIHSINADKPFNQLIREHLAGDVLAGDDPDTAIGSAFLVAGPYDDVGNQDAAQAAQIRANTLDEMIGATGQAFLALTLGCARCHDHKFDPITQQDYYGLYATFSAVRHGSVPLARSQTKADRNEKLAPLNGRKQQLQSALQELDAGVLSRANEKLTEYESMWTRPPVDRTGTVDEFDPVTAKFVRLVCEAQDGNPKSTSGFQIDEFEIWSAEAEKRNVALASHGARASGAARKIEDFPGAYGPQHAIDGKTGARFIAVGNDLTIELAQPTVIDRVVFSSARGEANPEHRKFVFVAEYRVEASLDGHTWQEVASSRNRKPIDRPGFLNRRLSRLETRDEDRQARASLAKELADVNRQLNAVPALPTAWIGRREPTDAKGPFHVFVGGDPQKTAETVVPASLSALDNPSDLDPRGSSTPDTPLRFSYKLSADAPEHERRLALANWIVHSDNPLTPRVLANRLWHYHFGTGIVDTPSDFGYMGGRPTHPELLDFLAIRLIENGWRIKTLHRLIMTSQTYQQASDYRANAASVDGDSRLLWRYPPRRLSAEEIRDTILQVSDKLDTTPGGPGFRLYHFMQDNVCTYVPLDEHGPETYRRAVYHQNARASVVDLMTEFDLPDCSFSAPRRSETTSPLQALTMLNHSFTLDMAGFLADRLVRESGDDQQAQIKRAFQLCYGRDPSEREVGDCRKLIDRHNLAALCRVLLNTSEMIYVR
jgi:hypothetical protein